MKISINDRFVNRTVDHFNNVFVDLKFNSLSSTFNFAYYFDPENQGHIEFSCWSHFHESTIIADNGEAVMVGPLLSQKFKQSAEPELANVAGYSKTGALGDCTVSRSNYPLQTDGLSLVQICNRLIAPFEIDLVVDPAVASRANKSLSTSTIGESETIGSYLTKLARQKDIIVSHTVDGKLWLTEANVNQKPIMDFDLSGPSLPCLSAEFEFNGQPVHSEILVQKQQSLTGGNAGVQVIKNPYAVGIHRPTSVNQTSGDDNDTSSAARRALANELRNIKLMIELDRWFVNDKLITPNNLLTIKAPKLYLPNKSKFFIEQVTLTGNESAQRATLSCVIPEVYTNEIPKSLVAGFNLTAKPHV